ncbi:hypothetical protein OCH239_00180 [Roseivivax halodurans JCM 10272]|uniref:Flagellar protein FlbB n=1 Tax=Roseivivax halodurans JCM 10272 TaxID=1449350 RepID=X7EMA6_9RHOB|nr:hypothetical protein [Roseivivax halodurans]ETX16301.1 hypothetical protein OCH239_00180 [Roseivivax halodurans JCM 10272]
MKRPSLLQVGLGAFATAAILRTALPFVSEDISGMFVSPAEAADAEQTDGSSNCEPPEVLMRAIREERELLAAQKEHAAAREAELALLDERLAAETSRLDALREELSGLLDQAETAQNADLDRLVALYRNMKPEEAALIMNDLDLEVSILVLGTMPERDAAPIMARLSPVRARAISKIILERAQLPGDQDLSGIRID